ncbi:DNA replication protein [Salmonella enterica subsp. enterica serovar Agona]|uniref:replication protein n=1 Tax=Salmonella enterica TaxID=28901 RepID=UPI0010FBA21E|nr:replication protein [Salmonella enterica]EBV0896203.1 DNA replication protein [Salmonella enterica subsp. enterica serovar Agona]EBW7525078.1 DNA replication protein [Salmonella enterica subsp. enterica serovar Agona]MDQ7510994.1 replication protein [Salmonella enterica subsp. enterica serovar Agona]TKZ37890.1 DNA replication protein [Salmonella enterica subsp. enterica serovar Agona]TKZ39273.1 DNA replication protein [Salmonella enterica subsp. enterica serovar Agona]
MSNVAYADFGAVKAPVERKVAELEDGYAKLSNMLLEAYAGADLTKRQFKVLLAILRKTYGWNKPMDRISDSQISEIAKLPVKRCNEAKLELVRMGLIKQQGGMFGPNKNIDEWRTPQNEGISLKTGDKTSLNLRESYPSKQGDTKDTIQKTINTNTPLPPEGEDAQVSKPEKRKADRTDYQAFLMAYNEEVGELLPHAVALNETRKRRLKKLIPQLKTPNVEGWRAYVKAFVSQAKPFYFGQNDTGWAADIDYLLRDKTLLGVREAKFADKGMQ